LIPIPAPPLQSEPAILNTVFIVDEPFYDLSLCKPFSKIPIRVSFLHHICSLSTSTILDQEGNSVSLEQIELGTLFDITYDGMIAESYPLQIPNIWKIQTIGEEDCLIPLYLELFHEFYGFDSELNGETYMAVDLTGFSNLSVGEKAAFLYLLQNQYPELTVLEGTYESMVDDGYIISSTEYENFMYFPDGTLYRLNVIDAKNNSFRFSISKWVSGMGAYGSDDCKAKKDPFTGEWGYELGGFWIS
jgi:hypothetical protein